MTITSLIIINIAFILSITLSFILGRKSVMKKTKKSKRAKKAKKAGYKTKKIKGRVTSVKNETGSKKAVSVQKKQIDLDPNHYIENMAKETKE